MWTVSVPVLEGELVLLQPELWLVAGSFDELIGGDTQLPRLGL